MWFFSEPLIKQLVNGLKNIDYLVQALCQGLRRQKWAQKAPSTSPGSLQNAGGGAINNLTNVNFHCAKHSEGKVPGGMKGWNLGIHPHQVSTGKWVRAETHKRNHCGPQGSLSRAYAVTRGPSFHRASCEKKHLLARAEQVQPSQALGLSWVRNSDEDEQLVHNKTRVLPISWHTCKIVMLPT